MNTEEVEEERGGERRRRRKMGSRRGQSVEYELQEEKELEKE